MPYQSPLTKTKLPSGTTYEYLYVAPDPSKSKETILFLHGFPSSIHDWHHQIPYFSAKGYGILAPHCLGYGGTDKPLDYTQYRGKKMAGEIAELLDHLRIETVIGVGHDWGSFLLSRLATYHRDRFTKYAFIDVGYLPPGKGLSRQIVEFVNEEALKHAGYSVMGYFLFFDEEDSTELIDSHPDSLQSLFHSTDPENIKKYMGATGGTRKWVSERRTAEWAPYLTEEDITYTRSLFSTSCGGYGPAKNWYLAQLHSIDSADEVSIPESEHALTHPTFLATSRSPISEVTKPAESMKRLVKDLTVRKYEAGHWVQLEQPQKLNADLEEWIAGV